jgi:hypothetical protein
MVTVKGSPAGQPPGKICNDLSSIGLNNAVTWLG